MLHNFHRLYYLIVLLITIIFQMNTISMKSSVKNKTKHTFIKTKQDLLITLSKWPKTITKTLELHVRNSNFKDIQQVFNLCASDKHALPIPIEQSDFIFNQPNFCVKHTNLWILIVVHTHPSNKHKRDLIRGTWGSLNRVNNRKIGVLFFMGLSNNLEEQKIIEEEERMHNDIVQRAFLEHYHNMTRKHLTVMEWISTGYCNKVPFLVKADDDTFIDIFHLVNYLENRQTQLNSSFYCSATANVKVKRPNHMKNSKWEITNKEFSDNVFPTYCEGFGYVMDMKLAPYLYWCSMFTSPIWIDDVYVTGILAENLGIQRIPFQSGHGYYNLKPGREDGSLADSIFLISLYNEFYPLTFQEMWRESVMYSMQID
ncbi:unnamed protein product [Trichobilharzia szidati]|nr:unnamed protein product [Trichobilharzia szidati]